MTRAHTAVWRALIFAMVLGPWALLLGFGVRLPEGFGGVLEVVLLGSLTVTVLHAIYGASNALFGFGLLASGPRPERHVLPELETLDPKQPIAARTAVAMVVHNEDPEVVFRGLWQTGRSIAERGLGHHTELFLLSDTTDAEIAREEEERFERLSGELRRLGLRVGYRRRESNEGQKVGNIREWGARNLGTFDFLVLLDADSVMEGRDVERLIRLLDQHPHLGMVQTLVLGSPASSPFARIFQFGMRAGMRTHALGAALWQGDAGPCWGHNVILRLRPYMERCEMPGPYLSHDQVEAALMRAAGYHVRVYPVEGGSFEDNPPDLIEFIRRDLRWCQGNLQYLPLLFAPGFRMMGRVQLALALLMYLAPVAWMVGTVAGFVAVADGGVSFIFRFGVALFPIVMFPKLAGYLFHLWRPEERPDGVVKAAAGMALELVLSFFIAPIAAVSVTLFVGSMLVGRRLRWTSPKRSSEGLHLGVSLRRFWPHTIIGALGLGAVFAVAPEVWPFALPLVAPLLFSAPFASLTASPSLGQWLVRHRLCPTPMEAADTASIRAAVRGPGGREPTSPVATLG